MMDLFAGPDGPAAGAARMGVEKVRPLVTKGITSKYPLEGAQYTLEAKDAALAQA